MAKSNKNTTRKTWQEHVVWASSFFATSTSRKRIQSVLIVLLVVVFIWLVYSRAYSPLKEDVPLPVSIDRENPSLDLEMLQTINKQRAERVKRNKPNYFNFSRVFIVPEGNE